MTRILTAAGLAAVLLTGCGHLPPLEHVVLSPPPAQRPPAHPSQWVVKRVNMPDYLDDTNIEMRTGDYVLTRLSDAKWAERLPIATTRLLQQTIDEKLQNKRDRHYTVHVDVNTFEPERSGYVVLAAQWRVVNAAGHVVDRHDAVIKESLKSKRPSPDQIGRAMSEAVSELAMQIVARAG